MIEPKRFESPAAEVADRESRSERLLVEGLDHYFNGRFDDAIHIWTRVLFLDRTHARARAYIDRARTAIAERQRQSDELVQAGHDLLEQGRTSAVRDLLREAVAALGDDDRVSALRVKLERIERLERLSVPATAGSPAALGSDAAVPGWRWPARSRRAISLAVLAGVLFVATVAAWPSVQDLLGWRRAVDTLSVPGPVGRPLVLSSADAALIRARNLYARGRLAEALQALDRVPDSSTVRAQADDLRVQIQQLLLAAGGDGARAKVGRQ